MALVVEDTKATDPPKVSGNIPSEPRRVQPKSTMPYQNVLENRPGPYRIGTPLKYPYIDR